MSFLKTQIIKASPYMFKTWHRYVDDIFSKLIYKFFLETRIIKASSCMFKSWHTYVDDIFSKLIREFFRNTDN